MPAYILFMSCAIGTASMWYLQQMTRRLVAWSGEQVGEHLLCDGGREFNWSPTEQSIVGGMYLMRRSPLELVYSSAHCT